MTSDGLRHESRDSETTHKSLPAITIVTNFYLSPFTFLSQLSSRRGTEASLEIPSK